MITANLLMKKILSMVCAVLLSVVALTVAAETNGASQALQNNVENIAFLPLQGGKIEVKVSLTRELTAPPVGFTTNNPPRIALDFPGTANLVGKSTIDVGESTLRTMNIVQSGSRTRLVLNLAKPVSYETHITGKDLIITLQSAATITSSANVTTRFAEAGPAKQKHNLRDVDFRRGSNGEGRVIVGLSDSTTGIDIRKQGKNLIVEFIDTAVPENLERRLDVLDFGTPVRALSTYRQGKNTRMVIEPQGLWEYSAYQADRQFIVDVKKVIEDPNKMVSSGRPGYAGEKLSLNFQNVEVRTVLQVIADFTNLNIITSDSVTGSLTLRLKDVPWDQALDIILNAKGLDKRKNGNVVWVAPRDELAAKEKMELEARKLVTELEPLQTEYYALNYLRADLVSKMLDGKAGSLLDKTDDATCAPEASGIKGVVATGAGTTAAATQKILSNRGSATFELKTNMLIVNDIPSKHEEIRRLLAVIDLPAKQVMIEARVVLASDKFGRQLGVRFGNQSGHNKSNYNLGISGNLDSSSAIASGALPSGGGNLNVNLPVVDAAGSLAFTLLNLGNGNLINLELSAMEADNRGNVISNPRVMTSNQRPAAIVQGVQIPVVTPGTATSPPTTTYKDVLLCLLVNPQVLNNDSVLLDVEVRKDVPGEFTKDGNNRAVNVARVKTQILLNNGDTAVLGGIFQQETQNDTTKVPLFGDLPVVGGLFRSTSKVDDKRELMIFITPKILKESLNIQ